MCGCVRVCVCMHTCVHACMSVCVHCNSQFPFLINILFPCIVSSFLELYSFIFKIPGVKCFLSNRICQDPLEKYFGMQRQSGGTNDNPTVMEFAKNSDTLRLVGNMWFDDAKGNCRKSNSIKQSIEDTKVLPLRKRQRYTAH